MASCATRTRRTSHGGAEIGTDSAQTSPEAVPILARLTDLTTPLRELFGFDAFRPGQEDVVREAIAGRDTLALMPTGSGKSLTYQLAAMLRPEPTLVLSPLIALMKDQVDKLPPAIAATATFVNSSLSAEQTAERLAAVEAGETRLVYAAPERLRQARFVELLSRVGIGLVVVDEVHCVSMWGHDFRPDYLFIRRGLEALGDPTILGMTATATPETARDIGQALGRELEVVHTSVVRPNLRYDVQEVANAEDRIEILVERLRALRGGSAIVYARSRRSTEELARVLRGHGFPAEHYHAGLEPGERTRVQDDFVADRAQAVVATTAFGMGIDKPDVRLVCLVNYPDSLEGYVQMVGRAGRDGEPSQTLLLASPTDATALRRFAVADVPSATELRSRLPACSGTRRASSTPTSSPPLVPDRDARVLVGMLEQAEPPPARLRRGAAACGSSWRPRRPMRRERVERLLDRARLVAESRADRIVAFAETRVCRHEQVAAHFGESFDAPCGSVRRLRSADARIGVDLEPAASAARGHRRGDRRRGRVAHLAARSTKPGRDAPRVAEGAAVGTALARVPASRGRDRRRRAPLGAARRELGSAGRGDHARRVPRPPRRLAPYRRPHRNRRLPPMSTRISSRASAAGASSDRRRTPSRRTSSSTTPRCASSRRSARRRSTSSPRSKDSAR